MSAAARRRVRDVWFHPAVLLYVVEEQIVVQEGLREEKWEESETAVIKRLYHSPIFKKKKKHRHKYRSINNSGNRILRCPSAYPASYLLPVEVFSTEEDELVFLRVSAQRGVQPEHITRDTSHHLTLTLSHTTTTRLQHAYLGDGGGHALSSTCVFFASSAWNSAIRASRSSWSKHTQEYRFLSIFFSRTFLQQLR